MDEKLFKRRETKAAQIRFESGILKRLDEHAKRLNLTRTRLLELIVSDAFTELDKALTKGKKA